MSKKPKRISRFFSEDPVVPVKAEIHPPVAARAMSDEEWAELVAEGQALLDAGRGVEVELAMVEVAPVSEVARRTAAKSGSQPLTNKKWECNEGCYCCNEWEKQYQELRIAQRRFRYLNKIASHMPLSRTFQGDIEMILNSDHERWSQSDEVE